MFLVVKIKLNVGASKPQVRAPPSCKHDITLQITPSWKNLGVFAGISMDIYPLATVGGTHNCYTPVK